MLVIIEPVPVLVVMRLMLVVIMITCISYELNSNVNGLRGASITAITTTTNILTIATVTTIATIHNIMTYNNYEFGPSTFARNISPSASRR